MQRRDPYPPYYPGSLDAGNSRFHAANAGRTDLDEHPAHRLRDAGQRLGGAVTELANRRRCSPWLLPPRTPRNIPTGTRASGSGGTQPARESAPSQIRRHRPRFSAPAARAPARNRAPPFLRIRDVGSFAPCRPSHSLGPSKRTSARPVSYWMSLNVILVKVRAGTVCIVTTVAVGYDLMILMPSIVRIFQSTPARS